MAAGGRWAGGGGRGRRRGAAGAIAALMMAVGLSSCGDPNEGDAFAAEFGAWLDAQDAVVSHDSGGTQPLPFHGDAQTVVTLAPSLDDAAVVDAATTIVSHRPKTDISSHDLTIRFSADSTDAASPIVSFYVQAATPLPDDAQTRGRVEALVEEAQRWVPADAGLTAVTAEAEVVTVETTTEPLTAAPALAEVLAAGSRDVRTLEVESPAGDRVVVDDGGDLAWLADVPSFVEQARSAAPTVTYQATASGVDSRYDRATPRPADPPALLLTLPDGTDDATLAALEALSAPSGVDVDVFRPPPARTAAPTP
ncbi:hypothetical protein [Aeromicrobium fastidiosum]|uniref:Uncharacterized protein n=1 Tax=Aeromicrobium fastidiosum TaxID=52699 RepID=A0A641ARP2_9ACTN|nr:hypothetical protein [Aeromicrobium fastidiosum]KAA1380786.1 hypothetical protein ESP62_006385 [Aeromicrobium fastidiosum]MBP2390406.1 hypothetical protein [Aeromicrobium fastidiosum]